MVNPSRIVKRAALLAAALLAFGCTDSAGPERGTPGAPLFSFSPNGITLNKENGSLGYTGRVIRKGFNPTNPHHGDAVIATFFWVGSTNIIDSVTDVLTDVNFTKVGNRFTLVEYVTAGGISMATYVATNIQNFPDSSTGDVVYAVQADLRESITDGGVKITAWTGVEDVFATALGAHRSASGSGSAPTAVAPGAIAVGAGGLAYAVTMANQVVPSDPPPDFTSIGGSGSDAFMRQDGRYRLVTSAATVDPQWTWYFDAQHPGTWLGTILTLRPAGGAANQPPVAAFSASCSALTCSFTNTSSDPDGSIASNSWNFGDGQTSTAASPSHTYAAAGTYTVTLSVTDNQGATNAVSHSVTVTQANQSPTAAFSSSCSALMCSFTNTSGDPDGSISSNSWNFGDGQTSTAASPSHTYGAAGTYTVTLTVTDNQGATGSVQHTVTVSQANQAPTANFTFSCNALTCTFTSTSSDPDGSITSYSWTFGDGGTSTAQNPSRTYGAGGSYTVTLRVTDNQGAQSPTTSKTVTVTAPNQPPTANFTFSCNGLSCGFTSTSSDPDGSIASYSWNFGDGGTSTAQNPSHTYATGGTRTVTLTVTDNRGATNSRSQSVTVTLPNRPPVVNAGADQVVLLSLLGVTYTLNASFSDPDNDGPWSYTINWGDGNTSTGTSSSQGTISASHHYANVISTRTVTVTVRDAHGASGSDSKVLTLIL